MRHISILAFLTLVPSATAQLQFAPVAANYIRVLNGKTFVGSRQVSSTLGLYSEPLSHSQLTISPGTISFASRGNDIPLDAKLDPSGNIWIAGNTDSDDFPLVNPVVSHKVPYRIAGFVLELDPTASKVLFSTYLGGQQASIFPFLPFASHATALTIDSAGNVYIGGDTDEPDFPRSAGGILPNSSPNADDFGATFYYSYAVKLSPAGSLIYSTLVTTGSPQCYPGSDCIGRNSTYARVSSLAVDSTGNLTASGASGGQLYGLGYVSRLAPDASKFVWTSQIGTQFGSVDTLFLAIQPSGNIALLGRYASVIGFYQLPGTPGLFYTQIDLNGQPLPSTMDLGQSPDSVATGIVLDASGNPYIAGTSSSAALQNLANVPNLGADFVLGPGAQPKLFRFPRGVVTAPPTFDASGNLQLLGAEGALITISPGYNFTTPLIVGFGNSASYAMNTGLYRGSLISIFGFDLPSATQVNIGGNAQILYDGATQINVQVPPSFSSPGATPINVVLQTGTISFTAPAVQSVGLFTTDGTYAAALNQDGSGNSAANPAAIGSLISLFGTGTDSTSGSASINSLPTDLLYFGAAPGLSGVFQANIRLSSSGPIILQTASSLISNPVIVYTK